jgi:hypothetical protein
MKKLLGLTLSLASIGFVASSAEAKAAEPTVSPATIIASNTVEPQWRDRNRRGRYNSRVRVTTQTRLVRQGRRVYRETYQVRYLPNGRTQTRLISRVRVR